MPISPPMSQSDISSELNTNYYLDCIAFTLLWWDFLVTFDWEVSRYWGTRFSWPTVLFFVNRYGSLLGNLPVVVQRFWTTPSSPSKFMICHHLEYYHKWFIIIIQILIGVMLVLRTYALYERNPRILALMVLFGACVIGTCTWATIFSGAPMDIWPGPTLNLDIGCTFKIVHARSTGLIIAWSSLGIFDAFIFSLTLYRALSRRHLTDVHLLNVLLRDGSIYFGIMLGGTIANVLTFIYGGLYTRGVATTLTNIISSIMISRLMLNLRDPALRESEEDVFSTYMAADELSTLDANGWP